MEPHFNFQQISAQIQSGKLTCAAVVDFYLQQINALNAELNAFLEVYVEEARQKAAAIDAKIQAGKAGKLAGMVVGIKDNICYRNHKVSASSKILEGFTSLFTATAVERLLAEDAIVIGRLNCDEFAMGSSNENSAFGLVRNPIQKDKVTGGSSGGSVAAVAAGMCTVALGSDTGGSIRQPASFTGLVGFKPTYGRVSRNGLIAYASSFDQIGPLTRNVADAALVMEVMAGKDTADSTSAHQPVDAYFEKARGENTAKKRIAVISECINDSGLDPEIRQRTLSLIESLKAAGHSVEEVSFPYLDLMVPVYYVLTTAEASSNLSRFGGIIYGHRSKVTTDIDSAFRKSRTEGFGEEVKRRIMLGTFVLSSGYYDAYYSKAQKVRRIIRDKTAAIFEHHDFILMPTTPITAFQHGAIKDPVTMYLQDIYTVQSNLAGNPSVSLPLGKHSNGLPFGIQLMGKSFGEAELFGFSSHLMKAFN